MTPPDNVGLEMAASDFGWAAGRAKQTAGVTPNFDDAIDTEQDYEMADKARLAFDFAQGLREGAIYGEKSWRGEQPILPIDTYGLVADTWRLSLRESIRYLSRQARMR